MLVCAPHRPLSAKILEVDHAVYVQGAVLNVVLSVHVGVAEATLSEIVVRRWRGHLVARRTGEDHAACRPSWRGISCG